MVSHKKYLKARRVIKEYKEQLDDLLLDISRDIHISKFVDVDKDTALDTVNLSTRLRGVLNANLPSYIPDWDSSMVIKVGDLKVISIAEFRSFRNVGRETLEEFMELCHFAGVKVRKR